MIKASSLYYAVLICAIVSLFAGGIILFSSTNKQFEILTQSSQVEIINLQNGVQFAKANSDALTSDFKSFKVFEDSENELRFRKIKWGLFDLVCVKQRHEKHFFLGSNNYPNEALYLSDKNSALNLTGNTQIIGDISLPKKGVKRAYILGKNFVGDKLFKGVKKNAKEYLPKIYIDFQDDINQGEEAELDFNSDTIFNSFSNKTLVLDVSGINLENRFLQGNVLLKSKDSIFIPNSCMLNDVIVSAPTVYVEKGFRGNAQFYCENSFIAEEECKFEYPSVLVMNKKENDKKSHKVQLMQKTEFRGLVVATETKKNFRNPLLVEIDELSVLIGGLYTSGSIQLKGKVFGFIYTNAFHYSSGSGYYKNHLIDCEINRRKLRDEFLLPNIFSEQDNEMKVVKFVE